MLPAHHESWCIAPAPLKSTTSNPPTQTFLFPKIYFYAPALPTAHQHPQTSFLLFPVFDQTRNGVHSHTQPYLRQLQRPAPVFPGLYQGRCEAPGPACPSEGRSAPLCSRFNFSPWLQLCRDYIPGPLFYRRGEWSANYRGRERALVFSHILCLLITQPPNAPFCLQIPSAEAFESMLKTNPEKLIILMCKATGCRPCKVWTRPMHSNS